jgi:hypothetical protein
MTSSKSEANPLFARAEAPAHETATKTAEDGRGPAEPRLIPQAHGGQLLAGGKPGNRGGGRPKESLRQRMRELLDATLDAMYAALAGERSAAESVRAITNDPRITALAPEVREVIEIVCREHIQTTLTPREIGQFHETLARYGVGTQQEIESTEKQVRYVIRLPARPVSSTGPVAVVAPPALTKQAHRLSQAIQANSDPLSEANVDENQ